MKRERYKTDKERKDMSVEFRLNIAERKRLEQISKTTGLSFSNIFRLRVLNDRLEVEKELNEEIQAGVQERSIIQNSKKLSDNEKEELLQVDSLQRIGRKSVSKKMKKAG
jgi:hypothetical protein